MSWQNCPQPDCRGEDRPARLVIEPRARDIGGFDVRRVLPSARRRLVGPFVFLDEMGPAAFAPGRGIDVRPHPHIGLATITYLFEGEILHRDSLGFVQTIEPGAVNLMTAGRGIVHSERAGEEDRARESRLHGIQSWIALPASQEECAPAFEHHPADSLPVIERDGVHLRLIAGSAYGETSPVPMRSATFYLEANLEPGADLALPEGYDERAVYVVTGAITLHGERFDAGRMLVLEDGHNETVTAEGPAKLMLLGGAPLDGKRHIWWNFVSSRPARIEQAKADWQAGRFAKVPGDEEFIPLPES